MPVKFVCLANSFKLHGRCVAGIVLDNKNKPVINNLGPKWIRPISASEHGEIPTHHVSHIKLLDIVEINDVTNVGKGHQSENVLYNENSIQIVGAYPKSELKDLCENERPNIFGNRGKAVAEDAIYRLHHSLMMIESNKHEFIRVPSERNPDKLQTRLRFFYKNQQYDLAITDPVFLENYEKDPEAFSNANDIFVTLSLAINLNDWYHKLVAGIIY